MNKNDYQVWCDDFNGASATFPTSADPGSPWLVDDTSAAGTPTYTTGGSEATLTLDSTNEVENVCLHFGDSLDFDIDLIPPSPSAFNISITFGVHVIQE